MLPNNLPTRRKIDEWFDAYSKDHQNSTNQLIHVIAVPLILFSVIILLWCIPVGASWFNSGFWSGLAMFGVWAFYNKLSRSLGYGMLIFFFTTGCICRLLEYHLGINGMFWLALALFVVAWIAQFIGHKIEGKKPSFLTDLIYLLIGPLWVQAKIYRAMGWKY